MESAWEVPVGGWACGGQERGPRDAEECGYGDEVWEAWGRVVGVDGVEILAVVGADWVR